MGAWGADNLENDEGLNWLGGFENDASLKSLDSAFFFIKTKGFFKKRFTIAPDSYLDASEAAAALVAAEIVALALGKPSKEMANCGLDIDPIAKGVKKRAKIAAFAVNAVLRKSELKELWDSTGKAAAWTKVQKDLLSRLETSKA